MIRRLINQIPNMITCLSLACGCAAIIMSFDRTSTPCGLSGIQWAWILIGIAAVCDFLDGMCARLLHAYSNLGKQLDSLSDLVSFGVAPGMMMWNQLTLCGSPLWLAVLAVLIPVLGEVRLARFNIDDRQSTSFLGLPIPANAIFWIGACGIIESHGYPGDWVMAVALVVITMLMVTTSLRMFSLKFKNLKWRGNALRYCILVAAVLFVAIDGVAGLAWTILLYLLLSLSSQRIAE